MFKQWTICLALIFVALAAPAPARSQDKPKVDKQAQAPDNSTPDARKPATEDPNYTIGPQDVLDISVWKEPELTRSVPVRPDGKISLPLLNDVQAAGLTPSQLAAQITTNLKKFVTAPQVTVIVTAINSQRVFIIGEVLRPGAFPLLPGMTVLQALSSAGGFTQFASLGKIYVLRNENGTQTKHPFNYKAAINGKQVDQNFLLKAGDQIVVP
ncbi:MAG TPA: polysaccharide biosynthesis/export family protein [Candidatus Acidoferrales bacterium]